MADDTLLGGITTQMRYLAGRQRVLAQNIANSETPGYKARDLAAPDFASLVAAQGSAGVPRVVAPAVSITSGMAALGGVQPDGGGGVVLDRAVTETKPDGNNVTLEDQLLKMGQVQADFAAMANLYHKQLAMMRTALGRNGG